MEMNQAQIRKVRRTLIKARAIQAERGLAKGVFEAPTGRVCMSGAIKLAQWGDANANIRFWSDAEKYLGTCALALMEEAGGGHRLPSWNDCPERTLEEVLDLFDRTIERLTRRQRPSTRDRELVLA